jgi:hypothetical protein
MKCGKEEVNEFGRPSMDDHTERSMMKYLHKRFAFQSMGASRYAVAEHVPSQIAGARLVASDVKLFTLEHWASVSEVLIGTPHRELSSTGTLHAYEIDGGPGGIYWAVSVETEHGEWPYIGSFTEVDDVLEAASTTKTNVRLYTQEKYCADQEALEQGTPPLTFTEVRAFSVGGRLQDIAAQSDGLLR